MTSVTSGIKGAEHETHVFCADCWWSDDVPAEQAAQVAAEHEKTDSHIANELAGDLIEAVLEQIRVERGY